MAPATEEDKKKAQETHKRKVAVMRSLRLELESLGHKLEDPHDTRLDKIEDQLIYLRVNEDRRGSGFFIKPTGKLRVSFTGFDYRTKQFPESKGGFDIKKIAAAVSQTVKDKKASAERDAQRKDTIQANEVIATALNEKFGLNFGSPIRAEVESSGRLTIRFNTDLSERQAKTIMQSALDILSSFT